MPTRRRFVALAAAVLAAGTTACSSSPAHAVGTLVDVEIVDRDRNALLPVHPWRGQTWVAGRPGERYAVRLVNRSGARVLAVLSVDGVNAVTGETAAVGQAGYVLAPYQSTEIIGWRKSLTEAAAFYFTALPDSYAARTDRPDNVGVIGVAVFRERERDRSQRELEALPERSTRRAAPDRDAGTSARGDVREAPAALPMDKSAAASTSNERLGTGHGGRESMPTSQTTFDRDGDRPAEVVRLRYDSQANLVAMGVIRVRRLPVAPDPFPTFVPDPRG